MISTNKGRQNPFQRTQPMTAKPWTPTWHPEDLGEGVDAWLAEQNKPKPMCDYCNLDAEHQLCDECWHEELEAAKHS